MRGWKALLGALQPDGSLGWVQQVSDRPDSVAAADTQYYGVGAFLLAATQIARIAGSVDRAMPLSPPQGDTANARTGRPERTERTR